MSFSRSPPPKRKKHRCQNGWCPFGFLSQTSQRSGVTDTFFPSPHDLRDSGTRARPAGSQWPARAAGSAERPAAGLGRDPSNAPAPSNGEPRPIQEPLKTTSFEGPKTIESFRGPFFILLRMRECTSAQFSSSAWNFSRFVTSMGLRRAVPGTCFGCRKRGRGLCFTGSMEHKKQAWGWNRKDVAEKLS